MSNGKGMRPVMGYNQEKFAANWDTIRWGPRPTPKLGHAALHPTIVQTKIVKARTVKKGKK